MTVSENSATPQARLLGHEFSLYSGKARAYLRHKQIPFVEGVTPEDRKLIEERVRRTRHTRGYDAQWRLYSGYDRNYRLL